MKYFINCKFLEGTQTKRFLGFKIVQTKPIIDLISIALVAEDGREYYAISKDFNLKEAWNRFQWKDWHSIHGENLQQKEYWIRENVLKPIWNELLSFHLNHPTVHHHFGYSDTNAKWFTFSYKDLKWLISKYGKTNQQIAEDIKDFVYGIKNIKQFPTHTNAIDKMNIQFYGYYADYDWVAFCWLFGRMIDLPNGFPMYCVDLKQELDKKVINAGNCIDQESFNKHLEYCKKLPNYPKQTNEHNALSNARWNKELYDFLNKI